MLLIRGWLGGRLALLRGHIDYGLGAFDGAAFDGIPGHGAHDLADVYRELLDHGELAGFEVQERFYETGSFAGIQELSEYLASRV